MLGVYFDLAIGQASGSAPGSSAMYLDHDGRAAGSKKGRLFCTFMDRTDVIWLINRPAMEDQVFEYIYGKEIPRDIRRPLMWLVAYQAKYKAHAPAEKLNETVEIANRCTRPTARKHIKRARSLGLLSEEKEGKNVFYFLDHSQINKVRAVIALLKKIEAVVVIQANNPHDKKAGSDLLPADVYYNLIDVADFPEM